MNTEQIYSIYEQTARIQRSVNEDHGIDAYEVEMDEILEDLESLYDGLEDQEMDMQEAQSLAQKIIDKMEALLSRLNRYDELYEQQTDLNDQMIELDEQIQAGK